MPAIPTSLSLSSAEDGPVGRRSESGCDFLEAQIDLFPIDLR